MINYIKSFFNNYTIIHAVNNPRIEEEFQQDKNSNLATKLKKGIYVEAKTFIQRFVIFTALSTLAKQLKQSNGINNIKEPIGFIYEVIIGPIVEEIIFRGILQNGMHYAQKFAKWAAPRFIRNTRVFEWLTSPSARILGANSLFALVHLGNKGAVRTVALVGTILLMPRMSILHETTGNIAAPIVCHMTHNLSCWFFSQIARKL